MSNYLANDPRIRRRLWFTLHVLLYSGLSLVWSAHPLLLVAQSALLITLSLHLYGLYASGFASLIPAPIPVKVETQKPQPLQLQDEQREQEFWYQWHDV